MSVAVAVALALYVSLAIGFAIRDRISELRPTLRGSVVVGCFVIGLVVGIGIDLRMQEDDTELRLEQALERMAKDLCWEAPPNGHSGRPKHMIRCARDGRVALLLGTGSYRAVAITIAGNDDGFVITHRGDRTGATPRAGHVYKIWLSDRDGVLLHAVDAPIREREVLVTRGLGPATRAVVTEEPGGPVIAEAAFEPR